MIKADTPNLWEIRNCTDHATAVAILVTALIHLARLVNLDGDHNLNEVQIGEIANDVISDYGYLKVEEVKYILKMAAKSERIYNRLDYNVVMGWFEQYDKDRTNTCMDISDQSDSEALNVRSEGAVSFNDWVAELKAKADSGDVQAVEKLKSLTPPDNLAAKEPVDQHQKDVEFMKWKYLEYLKNKQPQHG